MPLPPRRSPLFSAIVLAGVSLTGGAGCSRDETVTADDTGTATDTKTGDGSLPDTSDTGSASDTKDAASDADTLDADDACPPDSETPLPPCVFIK